MKVLFVTSSYPAHVDDPRGVFIHRLARGLVKAGAGVTVLAPGSPEAPAAEVCDGVEVYRAIYWIPRWQSLARGLGGITPNIKGRPWLALQIGPLVAALTWRAARLASDCDVVHAHWLYPSGLAGLAAARWHRKPFVVTSHGGDLNLAQRVPILESVSRRVAGAADCCIGVSQALVDRFTQMGVPAERLKFVPLGVDLPSDSPALPDTRLGPEWQRFVGLDGPRLVYVGSLIPRKSVHTLLEAVHLLAGRGHDPVCAILGTGPSEESLRLLARRNGTRNVIFAGQQGPGRIGRWLRAGDIFVLPSLSEGRPVAIMEAMAQGLPVVASDIPGSRELVRHGESGLLFEAGDASALATALETLIEDDGLRQRLGARARDSIVRAGLTTQDTTQSHLELYEEIQRRSLTPTAGHVG